MKALQGMVPGVEIVATSNEPGASMQVRVRGIRSMASGRNEPLYVVDGIPINGGIEDFNPSIIEKITVLKDASATAIYGSRGANGVSPRYDEARRAGRRAAVHLVASTRITASSSRCRSSR